MTHSLWVTLHILWKGVSSHLFLWPTASEWHCTFCEWEPHPSFPMTNSEWVTLHILWKAVSSHLSLWPTACKWQCICERQPHQIFPYGQQFVSYIFCERQSHHIFSYDQQVVCDIAHFMKGSLIMSFPMNNSMWVTFHILWKAVSLHLFLWPTASEWCWHILWKAVSSHLFLWQFVSDIAHFMQGSWVLSCLFLCPTVCERHWHCIFCERQSHHIFCITNSMWVTLNIFKWKEVSSHIFLWQQFVSDIAHFVKGSLIISFLMTNSKWVPSHFVNGSLITSFPMTNSLQSVTLHILWKAVSSHLFLWPTGSEWHCTFCDSQVIFSYDQQRVSDIAHLVSSHLFIWPTASEWHCTFCERHSHHLFSYDQQRVSDIAHFVKGTLITSFPMTNSLWVTLHVLWKAVSTYFFLWPTASEWHCTFYERQSYQIFSYDQQQVSDIAYSSCNCITSFPMTNSKWVILHVLSKAVSFQLFLWPTASE